jgi:pimeloyl-ACP methyl ester carboxylesterase
MFKREPLALHQPSAESSWHAGTQRHVDTVIFVHGILGAYESTWGNFPELLASDEDLPRLDILCWGYRSGLVPGSYQDVETEGDGLISDLESLIRDHNQVFLVGHSMGGLVILKGLTNRIRDQGGPNHPIKSVNRIVLYATPLHGSAVADVVLAALSVKFVTRLFLRVLPGKQLGDLRRGEFVNELLTDTNELIYRPPPNSLLAKRAIPVLACVAKHDRVVAKQSAVGIFKTPPPKYLEGTHTSIKLPDHLKDLRYLALKHQLVEGLTQSFHVLCLEVKTNPDPSARMAAAQRLDQQYGDMMLRCAQACVGKRAVSDNDLFEISGVIWAVGAKAPASPSQVMTQVYREYLYRNDPRLKVT